MLIDLKQLSEEALDGICREYILQQIDSQYDADFDMQAAMVKVKAKLNQGELLVNYSEVNETVTLTSKESLAQYLPNSDESEYN